MVEAGAVVLGGADRVEITGVRVEGGEIVVWVRTPDAQTVLCGACGARARSEGRRNGSLASRSCAVTPTRAAAAASHAHAATRT